MIFSFFVFLFNDILSLEKDIKSNLLEQSTDNKDNEITKNFYVRVLLDEFDSNNEKSTWNINSKKQLILRTKTQKFKFNNIEIKNINKKFYLNNEEIIEKLFRIDSADGLLKFNKKEFQGAFFLINENNKLLLINKVELEDYIYSVLFTESWPGWPLEVNKAFAIASRSYVISKFLENKDKSKKYYHVKNTNKHQTYFGTHKSFNLRKAVDETKGIVLGYNKKPILAMFDCCCGGIIPANISGFNFKEAPYLARREKCDFCKSCKLCSWQIEYDQDEFEQILKKEILNLKKIFSINLIKDKAEVVQKIIIKDKQKQSHILTGKKFYSLFEKVKSFSFSIKKNSNKVIVKGLGYGHHLGICQWGAREMVNQGWDYQSILKFYYPGTSFLKLQSKD